MIEQFHFRDAETVNQNLHHEYQNAHLDALSSLLNTQCANLGALLPIEMTKMAPLLWLFSIKQSPMGRLYLEPPQHVSLTEALLNLAEIARRIAQTLKHQIIHRHQPQHTHDL